MTITYSIPDDLEGKPSKEMVCRHNEDGTVSFIPVNEANSDYQAYLNKDNPQAALSTPIDTLASELSNPSTPQAGE